MNPLEASFPRLAGSAYTITSPATKQYNCIAWAAEDTEHWWWPDPLGMSFWPEATPREETLAAVIAAYASLGYVPWTDNSPEDHVIKVAIYARSGVPTHAARQLPTGRWTSKLGEAEDIEHDLPDLLGDLYGDVAAILVRRLA